MIYQHTQKKINKPFNICVQDLYRFSLELNLTEVFLIVNLVKQCYICQDCKLEFSKPIPIANKVVMSTKAKKSESKFYCCLIYISQFQLKQTIEIVYPP